VSHILSADITLPASSCATCAVAEVLGKIGVVFLHSRCGRGVTLVTVRRSRQSGTAPRTTSVEARTTAPREVLRPPLDLKMRLGAVATYRGKDAEPAVYQIEVRPIWEDGVVVGEPRQALVREGRVCGP